jgi:hypothetical protein
MVATEDVCNVCAQIGTKWTVCRPRSPLPPARLACRMWV